MRALSERDAEQWIYDNAFSTSRVGRIGLELEWLVVKESMPHYRVRPDVIAAALSDQANISFEPGGQLELSTTPTDGLSTCIKTTMLEVARLRHELATAGLRLVGCGLDPRPAERVVDLPRYAKLEAHYAEFGPIGKVMMCNAASIQVNLDAGDDSPGWTGRQRRWRLVNVLGPVFVAMFANSPRSPLLSGRSSRQVLRFHTDPTRTDPLPLDGDCRVAWARYALEARVIGIPGTDGARWTSPPPDMTMRDWLRGNGPRPPTLDDLMQHLKVVIPPVRARGYLELRMIDAQDGDDWLVPATVVGALLDDRQASDRAVEIAASLPAPEHRDDWIAAARHGLSRPDLARAAEACMRMALDTLSRLDIPMWARLHVAEFAHRYTFKGLCPADA
ncbi:MAG TPA: glutamate-cysteine ligase family protein [Candidatus Limnocylindrales bacterium]